MLPEDGGAAVAEPAVTKRRGGARSSSSSSSSSGGNSNSGGGVLAYLARLVEDAGDVDVDAIALSPIQVRFFPLY